MWAALLLALALHPSPLQPPAEIVAAIQVHGNTATRDDEIRQLAGVLVGAPLEATTVDEVAARLRATKRFQSVQVLKRFASISDPSRILLVIVVDEGAVQIEMTDNPDQPTRVVRRRRLNLMFLPVLAFEDGYGVTYGVRFARPEVAGKNSRLAFPLTWGGEKKAGAELEKNFKRGPFDRVIAGTSISRRTNPFYNEDDDRRRLWVRGERELVRGLRAGVTAGWQDVSFVNALDRFTHAGADVVADTRIDPLLPRNAIFVRAAWEYLRFGVLGPGPAAASAREARFGEPRRSLRQRREAGHHPIVNRTEIDARGYVGLFGQSIVAVRALRQHSDRPLPPYLKPLLGGMANLRGFAAGTAAGDTLVATSAELIVPLTSPLHVGKIGVSAFVDAGTAYDKGARFEDQTLKQGYGGSVWFSAAFLRLTIAVAHGRGSSTRVHVGGNLSF